ncbi:MAG: efflux RND transporter periplasmic adaptor subunit [Gammaproteobacteria bacterium]|jgi:HlyD family secretion protein
MKKWLIIIAIIILLVVVGIFMHSRSKTGVSKLTVTVKKGTIVEKAQAVGYIKPLNSITVKSQIGGIVAKIFHYEGEYVKTGEKLLEITPTPSPVEYATAYESVQEAKAVEKSSLHDLERYQKALKGGLISKSYGEYITAKKSYDTARSQRILAEQKLALLKQGGTTVAGEKLANIIVSPIEGYILNRDIDVGDPVISLSSAQSSTALFTIASMQTMMFRGEVDEMDAAKVHVGMPAVVIVGSIPNVKINGILTRISLQSEQQDIAQGGTSANADSPFSVGFQVEVTKLRVPKGIILRSGYSATADIKIKTAKNVLVLPERVIHFKKGQAYVLMSVEGQQKPKKQPVKIGLSDGMRVEIQQGLKLGDEVLDIPKTTSVAEKQIKRKHRKR